MIKKIISTLLFIICFGVFSYCVYDTIIIEKYTYDAMIKYIGRSIVLNGDTLIVVNYETGSMYNTKGFMLSNGVIVDEKIVIENEIGCK